MAIDLKTLGSKLAKYRGQFKESIIEVASSTGIDAARLTAIEAGHAEPTGGTGVQSIGICSRVASALRASSPWIHRSRSAAWLQRRAAGVTGRIT